MSRPVRNTVLSGGLLLAALGCGNTTESNEFVPTSARITTLSEEYKADGSVWPIMCEGPADRYVEATNGDTLLTLAAEHTIFVQPAAIGQRNIPLEVYVQAVADMNELADPDTIFVGHDYFMPTICQPQTIER